mmetsp:Transcript_2975/g.9111  ORF Transcript_2975/g.9111 Transcript_2975/m.9111 type:complete len:136 (+) Transcript_2975:971-1378(+)
MPCLLTDTIPDGAAVVSVFSSGITTFRCPFFLKPRDVVSVSTEVVLALGMPLETRLAEVFGAVLGPELAAVMGVVADIATGIVPGRAHGMDVGDVFLVPTSLTLLSQWRMIMSEGPLFSTPGMERKEFRPLGSRE